MKINIVLPYDEADKYYKRWAYEENLIDFENNKENAVRCTLSFSCDELCTYLKKIGHNVSVSNDKKDGLNIIFEYFEDKDKNPEDFEILVEKDNIILKGYTRRGVLYSAYELLEIQGIRWYSPEFEYIPSGIDFVFPKNKYYSYEMKKGRGFHFEDLQNESESFILWMARNRLNLHACHAHCKKMQEKLCMQFETGGHIFEKILNPLNIEVDGKYYIDTHREWYGKREGELTCENATSVQFCVSNKELLDRLSETVIKKLNTDWKNEEMISLDGFDTWGKSCNCEKCRKLGNGSDQNLKFMSHIREKMNEEIKKGNLRKNVKLSFCIYEGTNTMEPPQNPVPKNLIDAGDRGLFCPILRCYKHYINEECSRNSYYEKCLHGWIKTGLHIGINEYYNVSKFEDLPVLYSDKIVHDIRHYIKSGATSIMYMHLFIKEWGVRALNHYLMAVVSRNPDCNEKALIKKYFSDMYGIYAEDVKEVYREIEKATEYISSWRAWFNGSVLSYLMDWDGKKPQKPICCDDHLKGRESDEGYKTVALLEDSLLKIKEIKKKELENLSYENFAVTTAALNPVEASKRLLGSQLLNKLNEDIRGIKYGLDTFKLMTFMVDYYNALYSDDNKNADELFEKIYELGDKMCEYTYSVVFSSYSPEFWLRDALKRTQLKQLYYRIIALHYKKGN